MLYVSGVYDIKVTGKVNATAYRSRASHSELCNVYMREGGGDIDRHLSREIENIFQTWIVEQYRSFVCMHGHGWEQYRKWVGIEKQVHGLHTVYLYTWYCFRLPFTLYNTWTCQ